MSIEPVNKDMLETDVVDRPGSDPGSEPENLYMLNSSTSTGTRINIYVSGARKGRKLEIEKAKNLVLNNAGLKEAYIRAVCWRGSGEDMGVASQKNKVKMAIAAWEWGAYYGDAKTKGAKLDISKWNRPSPETIPSFAKAAGLYMICSMSKHSAEAKGCSDSLMRDYRGYVAEATGANIFFLRNGEVHTPLPDCFLNGITRQTIINILKKKGLKVFERHIEMAELEVFEQCWLTGTAAEVTPVGKIGDYNFEVGDFVKDLVLDYEKIVRE